MLKQAGMVAVVALSLAACARSEVTRTSANTIMIDAGAAPICGKEGAIRVANKSAAIETIKAGYERFIITSGQSQNNVSVSTLPGQYRTTGTMAVGGGYGVYRATTTYTPGPTIVSGRHDRSLTVVMFNKGDTGYEQGLDARTTLGPEWQAAVNKGIASCL